VVIAAAIALAWPKGSKGTVAQVDTTPAPAAPAAVQETTPTVAASTVPPPVDPIMAKAAGHAAAAEDALNKDDLAAAKLEITALEQAKPDYPAIATLTRRLVDAETKARQVNFEQYVADARKAIGERNIQAAKEAISRAADIQDGEAVEQLRASLAKLESPPATPAPVAVAPAATPAPVATPDKTDSEPSKSARTARQPETRQKPEPPTVKRATPRPQAQVQPPPEPKATPKPAVQSQTPPKPQAPRKVFNIPGS
jgi:hypothetical protein